LCCDTAKFNSPAESPNTALITDEDIRVMIKDHLSVNSTVVVNWDEQGRPIVRGSKTEGKFNTLLSSVRRRRHSPPPLLLGSQLCSSGASHCVSDLCGPSTDGLAWCSRLDALWQERVCCWWRPWDIGTSTSVGLEGRVTHPWLPLERTVRATMGRCCCCRADLGSRRKVCSRSTVLCSVWLMCLMQVGALAPLLSSLATASPL
jgi:hypothetical protein